LEYNDLARDLFLNQKLKCHEKKALALARADSSCPTPNLFDSSPSGVVGAYNDAQQIVQIYNN
jgi:hypothetical protein